MKPPLILPLGAPDPRKRHARIEPMESAHNRRALRLWVLSAVSAALWAAVAVLSWLMI